MAQIEAFRPFIYSQHDTHHIEELIAPPYDVIKPDQLRQLKKHPHNITHLTLPEGEGDERYGTAGRILREWIAASVLERRNDRAIYPYTQKFIHPETGEEITRTGLIVLLHLEPFEKGIVLPHERTLKGPREDRLRLMQETHANLEAIFGMFPDPGQQGIEALREFVADRTPLIEATDDSGTIHSMWEATDPEVIAHLSGLIADVPVYIVDGHHRYETALNYRNAWRAAYPDAGENLPVDSIMIYLSPMSDPGLVILPTHRIVHSLTDFTFDELLGKMADAFDLQPLASFASGFEDLVATTGPAFLLGTRERTVLATIKPEVTIEELVGTDIPPAVAELDVTILHTCIFDRMLGIDRKAQEDQTYLGYAKNRTDAIDALQKEETQLVVGLNPTRFEQVENVANSGDVMPQKSTYFYPKPASGLVVNLLDDRAD